MFLLICAASGGVWGLIGAYMVTDGRFDRAGLVAAALSPGIGLIIGKAAKRFADLHWIGQLVYALVALFVATALFGIALGAAHQIVDVEHGWTAPMTVLAEGVKGLVIVWWGMTLGGDVLWLWPLSLTNHLMIWNWLSGPRARGPQRLGLTVE